MHRMFCFAIAVMVFSASLHAQAPIRSAPPRDTGRAEPPRKVTPARPTPLRIVMPERLPRPSLAPTSSTLPRDSSVQTTVTVAPIVRRSLIMDISGTSAPMPSSVTRARITGTSRSLTIRSGRPAVPAEANEVSTSGLRVLEPRDPAKAVVGLVGAYRITAKDIESQLALLRGSWQTGPKEEVERTRRVYAREILNDWVDTKLLVTEAHARGITVTQQEVDQYVQNTAQLSNLKVPVQTRTRLLGIDEKKFQDAVTEAVLGDKLVRSIIHERIGDDMLRDVYTRYPNMFWFMPRRHVRQLFYQLQGGETPDALRDMQKKMNSIRRRLTWFGGKLEDYLTPNYASTNLFCVDLGWLTMGEIIANEQQFAYATVFQTEPTQPGKEPRYKLKLNEFSEVLQTPAGFYLFQVIEEQPARRKTLEESRVDVEHTFFPQVRDGLIKELEKKYKVARDPQGYFRSLPLEPEEETPVAPPPLRRGRTNAGATTVLPPPASLGPAPAGTSNLPRPTLPRR